MLYDKTSDTYSLNNDIRVIGQLFMGFNPAFVHFVRTIYNDLHLMQMEYPISYGAIPLNWGISNDEAKLDETYTYLKGLMRRKNITQDIKVEGIKQDSQYIHLTDKKGRDINDLLFDTNYLHYLNANENEYPIIVNAYAAHKYGFKVGETIELYVSNTVDRYERKIHPESYKEDDNIAKFKVVGISRGTNNEAYYTSQEAANKILGLPDGQTWNKTHKFMP
ncbi:MAG: hypothetical protein MJ219_01210 [Mycoplasmoidaceae bacterium]|nr:hypothetical protein [Mycoplasmoidaceae bacterium]